MTHPKLPGEPSTTEDQGDVELKTEELFTILF